MIKSADLSKALDNIDLTYDEVVRIANDISKSVTGEIDNIIEGISTHIQNVSNDDIRDLMLQLSLKSYSFSEIKEKSLFKAELGETLRKEAYAKEFNAAEGTVGVRDNTANINTAFETVSAMLYELVASMFKTKLDEIHRVINTLQIILTTRLSEAKMTQTVSVGEPKERTYLTE